MNSGRRQRPTRFDRRSRADKWSLDIVGRERRSPVYVRSDCKSDLGARREWRWGGVQGRGWCLGVTRAPADLVTPPTLEGGPELPLFDRIFLRSGVDRSSLAELPRTIESRITEERLVFCLGCFYPPQ